MSTAGLRGTPEDMLLWVKGLSKEFKVGRSSWLIRQEPDTLRAVDKISFDIKRGETFGLVGESGCGKSTAVRSILRLLEPTMGEVYFDGIHLQSQTREQVRALRRRMQIVFQDPHASLDPRMSVAQLVEEPLIVHGLGSANERREKVEQILSFVGIRPEQASRKPHAFSGGQRQRVGIARALVLQPELVMLDEPVSALDVSVQAQVLNLLRDLQEEFHLTYLFIVHDLALAEYFADRLAVLYLGSVMELGSSTDVFEDPLHPYTVALISAIPTTDPTRSSQRDRIVLRGEVNPFASREGGCRFRSRCPIGRDRDICAEEEPPLLEHEPNHWAACHFPGELQPTRVDLVEGDVFKD